MSTSIRQRSFHAREIEREEQDFAEFAAALAKVNELYFRLAKKFDRPRKLIPTYGRVQIIAPPEQFDELAGERGIVLGGGRLPSGEQTYTVLVPSMDQTYYLPREALHFAGEIVPESEIYKGGTVRVAVDPDGSGHLIKPTRPAKSRRR